MVIFFIFGFGLWLLLTLTLHWSSVIAGLLASLLTTLIYGGYFTRHPIRFLQPHRWFWLLVYIPYFIWFMIRANLDVAFRVLHPDRPINPGIVKIKTILKTDTAKVFLANSITLTPGTMTCDIDGEYLYIHWIDVRAQDVEGASRIIARPFEKILRRIFE
ncbi:Na+/H+ antiporter subunit E [candidate division WOR-3 bacterium]|uniref:Na+/H+ antiporter subunit E n=1 Tax=candidate division WOR-3 bacterium TaxID=2052148 RepID=A0A660SLX7_UNCW3|nr:MAG: Na+/H+ antiporter subunit E [candidate division WOR-3 bacterium]